MIYKRALDTLALLVALLFRRVAESLERVDRWLSFFFFCDTYSLSATYAVTILKKALDHPSHQLKLGLNLQKVSISPAIYHLEN